MALTVVTETSTYLLDLTAMTATRLPGRGAGAATATVAELRRDAEPVPLVAVSAVVIGDPMTLILRLREDGLDTVRVTTPVREVRS
jgi:hypothetical protein